MVTAAPKRAARRRPEAPSGFCTRAEVETRLGLTPTERDTFERAGILGPTEKRKRGDTRPVLYSPIDVGLGHMAMAAHRLGIRGENLRKLVEAVRERERRLVPGWNGTAVVDAYGEASLVPHGGDIGVELADRLSSSALIVVPLSIPALT